MLFFENFHTYKNEIIGNQMHVEREGALYWLA